jgi:hypothetical protein
MSAPALASGVQPSTLGTLTALGAMTRCLANLMLHGAWAGHPNAHWLDMCSLGEEPA